ncbi:MAG TPA: hypothetical protein VH143_22210 [Kofleriaceae bacterium]|jgi:hypothetical protein|nr:hypothetical protein [Kofleriaceae bacterium]
MASLESALQKALSVRLNLQISLSQLPIIEEWMDIHLDRWLEHNPTPPDMPNGEGVEFLAMLGSDLRRVWWGAWGDPRGFVPRMADYFKLCNIAKSDSQVLDQIGEQLEPKQVGSWIGVWGGKVTTGWHFMDPHEWPKVEQMFGTHEAKYAVKKWVDDHHITRVERFSQSIGDSPFSEIEFAIPGDSVDAQVVTLSAAFDQLTGAPLSAAITDRLRAANVPRFGLAVRIRGGHIVRIGGLAPGLTEEAALGLCADAEVTTDPKLTKLLGALGGGIARVEYGRAGERAGVDIHVEPGEPGDPAKQRSPASETPPSEAN